MVLIYVDDISMIDSNTKLVEKVIHQLESEYALKDHEEFNYTLGFEVTPFFKGLYLFQTKYRKFARESSNTKKQRLSKFYEFHREINQRKS